MVVGGERDGRDRKGWLEKGGEGVRGKVVRG